ncbi:MAG: response regulator, partial [Verrucomicrobiota bacterium]|nr:response regulator [Verrucomicrobiota bacterium]
DLLVTDVVMPGMSGRDLAEQLKGRYPGMQCLFMSGYTANVIAQHGILESDVHFLPKPFKQEHLAGEVRRLLDLPKLG